MKSITIVRTILARDYGLHDLPNEWLDHAIAKHALAYRGATACLAADSSVAFLVACEWQRGLTTRACSEVT